MAWWMALIALAQQAGAKQQTEAANSAAAAGNALGKMEASRNAMTAEIAKMMGSSLGEAPAPKEFALNSPPPPDNKAVANNLMSFLKEAVAANGGGGSSPASKEAAKTVSANSDTPPAEGSGGGTLPETYYA